MLKPRRYSPTTQDYLLESVLQLLAAAMTAETNMDRKHAYQECLGKLHSTRSQGMIRGLEVRLGIGSE